MTPTSNGSRRSRSAADGGWRSLRTCREEERFAVRSRVLAERPYSEIATELQCSELVIRKRVSRGLARMREQLRETELT